MSLSFVARTRLVLTTLGATVVARGQAVTIERLSLSIPSHTGREVKWQGKAIRPFGSSRSIAHIQTSDWGTGQRP